MKKNSEYKKKKAIKCYLDGEKVKQIAGAMKISTITIYSWIRQYNEKRNNIANEVTELKKLAERQQKMIEILKTVDCTVSTPLKEKLSAMENCMGNTITTCYVRLSLKQEELYRRKINSEAELYRIIENYINFYNSERLHSANHYKSPDEYEEEYYKK